MVGLGAVGLLQMLVGLVIFVLFIMVLIKQFQTAGPLHGIIGIVTCGLWTLIWGWMNANQLNIKKIMMIWTALIILNVILALVGGGLAASQLAVPTTTP